jgi:hypothetical protein
MFRLTRPAAVVGMVRAAGPVISCFPHELQYRVPGLNGLPQPSQYMFLPPSSLATDQYYVPHPKMFQAPAPLHHPHPAEPPPLHLGHFTLSPAKCPSSAVLALNPNEKVASWLIIIIAFDR